MAGKKPRFHRAQRSLDWDRGAQLRALNNVILPDRLVGLGSPVSHNTAMHVLRIIDDCQRKQETAWPSLATIAQRVRVCIRTVQRAFDALESISFIAAWNETDERGHPRLVASINWEVIFGCQPAPRELPRGRRRGNCRPRNRGEPDDIVTSPDDIVTSPDDIVTGPDDTVTSSQYRKRPLKRPREPLPLRPQSEHASVACLAVGWGEVEEELSERGIKAFESAARTAHGHVDPEHVLALCEHFDRHAASAGWTPGHLYVRICRARRWLDPDQGWPEIAAAALVAVPRAAPPPIAVHCPHCGSRPPHFRHPQGGGICSDCRRHFPMHEELHS